MKTKRIESNEVKDTSPIIPQRNKIRNLLSIYQRNLNEKQKQFLELVMDKNTKVVFVSGPAGTSKTYMSVYCALTLLNQRRVSDLIYIRSAVESSDT
jgi:phosphate starvation-inducible protein PhoH